MKNAPYKILVIIGLLSSLVYFLKPDISLKAPKQNTDQDQQLPVYSKIQPNQNDSLVGNYQTSNSVSGFKDLILDSTYTYAYKIYNTSGEEITLEGSWELSYKDQAQHIILHRPLPNKATQHLNLAKLEEHKFKVTSDGLTDLYTQEHYFHLETEEYSLASLK